ncbi:MAG: biopolymer transporter ExbD [Bacteroidaceae bacterium]|nr:biopolymer transporter ExbD [Bacteroidaceae bacterium]
MGKGKRKVPGLNQSSTADISFILLIFFLVTTSMDTDSGLSRRLPEWDPDAVEQEMKIKERNVMTVQVNKFNEIYVKNGVINRQIEVSELKDIAKEFIANPDDNVNLPIKEDYDIEGYGVVVTTVKHVISLQTDRTTNYEIYFQVQHELSKAYSELRDQWARKTFGKPYLECDEKTEQPVVRGVYSNKISEAEPKQYGTAQ